MGMKTVTGGNEEMSQLGTKPSAARDGFTKTARTTFKDITKRVNAHVPTELLERFKALPPHDTDTELSRLFGSEDQRDQEIFLVLLKTDGFLEALLTQDICDVDTAVQWIDEHPEDRGDILAARGTFMALKEAGVEGSKLFRWIDNLHTAKRYLECFDIAASGKSTDVMKGEIFDALIDVGFGWSDVEDWKCVAIGSGYIGRHSRIKYEFPQKYAPQ